MTLKPIPIRVLRHACPHCGRTHSRPSRAREHMARCWQNPEAKGCKTCKHFEPYGAEHGDDCAQGVDLTGHRACPGCGGWGWKGTSAGAEVPCNAEVTVGHSGDGREAKPGPIIGCASWEIDLEVAVEWLARVAGPHGEVTP